MAVTLKDIANEVGVRPSTVSLVLNRKPKAETFGKETREKIFEVARKLGYTPNATARALVTRKTRSLGFILSDETPGGWANTYFAEYLNGVERCCRDHRYTLNITLYNLLNIDNFIFPQKVEERGVDGVILNGFVSQEVLQKFEQCQLPCVCLGGNIEEAVGHIPTFSMDVLGQKLQVLRYLAERNHQKIAFLDSNSEAKIKSLNKLDAALAQSGLQDKIKVQRFLETLNFSDIESGRQFVKKLVTIPDQERPTAVICNDRNILGIIEELNKHNLSYPEDLSIISFFDSIICQTLSPAITAVTINCEEIGYYATKALLDHLESPKTCDTIVSKIDFPAKLVTRDSVQTLK